MTRPLVEETIPLLKSLFKDFSISFEDHFEDYRHICAQGSRDKSTELRAMQHVINTELRAMHVINSFVLCIARSSVDMSLLCSIYYMFPTTDLLSIYCVYNDYRADFGKL